MRNNNQPCSENALLKRFRFYQKTTYILQEKDHKTFRLTGNANAESNTFITREIALTKVIVNNPR